MLSILSSNDPEEARRIWQKYWPQTCLFDLFEVRHCFQTGYDRLPHFLVAQEGAQIRGLLALSWIEEEQYYGHFPGETWGGRTWLEHNKIIADREEIYEELLLAVPGPTHLRYLDRDFLASPDDELCLDEVKYFFYPGRLGFSFARYLQTFSGKSQKRLKREVEALESTGVTYERGTLRDIDSLLRLNLERFGEQSYFHDQRFWKAFVRLAGWLDRAGLLHVTKVSLGGRLAAVDLGAVWRSQYTVLAGGTDPEFPGVAKLINFHHLKKACEQRYSVVDFLAGDFCWKRRFHLTPLPLYKMRVFPQIEFRPNLFLGNHDTKSQSTRRGNDERLH